VISADHISRRYEHFLAVDGVSFNIGQGEIVGLLGHNGAGKTTIMKMITGYLEPSHGSITIDGRNIAEDPLLVQKHLGYLPENLPVYADMCVADYLDYCAELRGVSELDRPSAVNNAIRETELTEKALDLINTLSRGYLQRVGVAQAILHQPRFLVMDEPTNGLDPSQTQHMRDLIRRMAQKATVILSTHILQEVEAVCDRVMILRNGRLAIDEKLEQLQQSSRLLLNTDAPLERVNPALENLDCVSSAVAAPPHQEGRLLLPLVGSGLEDFDQAANQVIRALVAADIPVYGLMPERRNLETVFREANELREKVPYAA